MFERETTLYTFMNGYLRNVLRDIAEEDFTRPVPGSLNPPVWIAAHLALSNDYALILLGQPKVCPERWHDAFGPGKTPADLKIPYPGRAEILELLDRGQEHVVEAVLSADPEVMAGPQTFAFFQGTPIKTVGDCLALLMTTHLALHVGQLSLMRRQLGHAPLF